MGSEQTRAVLAVVISGIVLIGYQYFFAPKMAPMPSPQATTSQVAVVDKSGAVVSETINRDENKKIETQTGTLKENISPQITAFEISKTIKNKNVDKTVKYFFNSPFSIVDIEDKDWKVSFKKLLGLDGAGIADKINPLEIQVQDGDKYVPISFDVNKNVFSGNVSLVSSRPELGIRFSAEVTEDGRLKYAIKSDRAYKYRFLIHSQKGQIEGRNPREFVLLDKSVSRIEVGKDDSGEKILKWFGVDYDFHIFTVVFNEAKSVTYSTNKDGVLDVYTNVPLSDVEGSFVYVKKSYDNLADMGDNLKLSVDFGIFGILAVPVLRGLQFFYKFIPNYGVSIIFLTIILRILTFPLQHKSYKSMKRMQDIRPDIDKVKEKYKDDPQKMQKETMELFKKEKVNPFGGCLPLLIQLPIFMAFYQVLYNAVELIEAPFFGWVRDLSAKDPYYILPILMTVAMFIQQKMTPTTGLDPAQQKIMQFMPLIFGFIMKDLPSGLALYIFFSTVLGIIQQHVVYRTK